MDNNKKVNIILIVLAIALFCFCAFLIVTTKPYEGSETTLLKDMTTDELRVIGDKTDVYNNSSETVHIKGERAEGYLNPEDVFKEAVSNPVVKESDIIVDGTYESDSTAGELKMFEPGEDVEVLEEIIIQPEVETSTKLPYISFERVLRDLWPYRNDNDFQIESSMILLGIKGGDTYLSNLKDKPIIIIPFTIYDNTQMANVKNWAESYDKYKDTVNFVYLNTSMDRVENYDKIMQVFTELDIRADLPVFYDNMYEILSSLEQDGKKTYSYCLLNTDCFVVKKGSTKISDSELDKFISDIMAEKVIFDKQVEELKEIHNLGKIKRYSDITMYIEHVVDGKPIIEEVVEEEVEGNSEISETND